MTRLMLGGDRRSGEGAKPRKENRRETWCPGAGAQAREQHGFGAQLQGA